MPDAVRKLVMVKHVRYAIVHDGLSIQSAGKARVRAVKLSCKAVVVSDASDYRSLSKLQIHVWGNFDS
jgi:hypothetical protein